MTNEEYNVSSEFTFINSFKYIIAVTNAGGQVVYSTKVAAGENTVRINSHHLSSGLNVVSVNDANGMNENCKVIVKKYSVLNYSLTDKSWKTVLIDFHDLSYYT